VSRPTREELAFDVVPFWAACRGRLAGLAAQSTSTTNSWLRSRWVRFFLGLPHHQHAYHSVDTQEIKLGITRPYKRAAAQPIEAATAAESHSESLGVLRQSETSSQLNVQLFCSSLIFASRVQH